MAVGVQLVLLDLPAQGITMNAQELSGARLIAVRAVQHAFDESLLEFAYGFVKVDATLHHLIDEPFQLIFHDGTLRKIVWGPVATSVHGW